MAKIIVNNPRQVINGGAKKYYFKVKGLGGPKGDKGDKGDTGATGPEGPQGNAATVSIGSTTTLPVGNDATVTNSGSIYNAVLNFGIPQGPRGPQGATGAKGDKGDKGDQGNPGPQGEKGTNATVYVGTTSTLNPGSQATVYNSGTDSNAVLNFGIPKGEKGDTGPMPTIAQSTGQATDQVMSQKATTDALNTKQATITSSNKLSADLVDDTSTTNKFVTASDITNWNAKQNALTAGDNITISGDTISATDTIYTAGDNITITGTTISTPAIAPEVVAELPTTGAEGKLYLTPKTHTIQPATGNPITTTVAEEAGKIESFQLDGDTYQQASPNPDYPQQIQTVTGEQTVTVTGKNKINMPYRETVWNGASVLQNGTTLTMKPNSTSSMGLSYSTPAIPVVIPAGETITWSRTWLGGGTWDSGSFTFPLEITYSDETTETISLGDTTKNNYLVVASRSVTLAKDVVSVRLRDALCYSIKEMTGDIVFGVQLEYGSSASDYAPYSKQTYDINLGKNLLNPNSSEWQQGYWTYGGGSLIASSGRVCQINKTPVYEETTFTFTTDMNIAFRVDFWNLDGSASGQFVGWFDPTATNITKTFTVPANMCYTITLGWKGGGILAPSDVASNALMLELGSTATTYAPYFTPIELCKLGTYQDYIWKDGESWKVHKATGKTTLTDSTDFTRQSYGTNTYTTNSQFNDMRRAASEAPMLASSFGTVSWNNRATATNAVIYQNLATPNVIYLEIRNTSFTTLQELTTYLGNSPISVYYELATANDTTITNTTLIAQLEAIRTASLENGTNTITNTATGTNLAGDMEIGYFGFNPNNRYDKWLWLDLNNNYEQIGGE